mgnify:CR=1 FL=1
MVKFGEKREAGTQTIKDESGLEGGDDYRTQTINVNGYRWWQLQKVHLPLFIFSIDGGNLKKISLPSIIFGILWSVNHN